MRFPEYGQPGRVTRYFHRVTVTIASGKHPVSIPNLEVKPDSADGTATGRSWESRTPPDIHTVKGHPHRVALNISPDSSLNRQNAIRWPAMKSVRVTPAGFSDRTDDLMVSPEASTSG